MVSAVTTWYQSFGLSESGFHYRLPKLRPLVDALYIGVSSVESYLFKLFDELHDMLYEPKMLSVVYVYSEMCMWFKYMLDLMCFYIKIVVHLTDFDDR